MERFGIRSPRGMELQRARPTCSHAVQAMRGRCGVWCLAAAILALALAGAACCRRLGADESPAPGVPRPNLPIAAAPHPDSPSVVPPAREPLRVLVLRSGRVVQGEVLPQAGGYRVRLARGEMVVPFELTLLAAGSLEEAYRKQRDAMNAPTVFDHMRLARWCLAYRLYEPCTEQLKAALRLQPDYDPARRMLRRVVAITHPELLQQDRESREEPEPRTFAGFTIPPRQTLAGLPAEVAGDFVRRIQPLLLNRCGNARCHGGRGGTFSLTHRRGGRITSEQNLAAVLAQVEFEQPERSELLRLARTPHGTTPVAVPPLRQDQWETLRDWVYAAVGVPQSAPRARTGDSASPRPVARVDANGDGAGLPPSAALAERSPAPSGRGASADPKAPGSSAVPALPGDAERESPELRRERELLELLRGDMPDDPFSPAVFNERFGSPAESSGTGR